MNDDDNEEYSVPDSGLEMGDSIDSETHDDVDPFEELGIGSRSITSTNEKDVSKGYDAFSELMDDEPEDDEHDEITDSMSSNISEEGHSKSESTHKKRSNPKKCFQSQPTRIRKRLPFPTGIFKVLREKILCSRKKAKKDELESMNFFPLLT